MKKKKTRGARANDLQSVQEIHQFPTAVINLQPNHSLLLTEYNFIESE